MAKFGLVSLDDIRDENFNKMNDILEEVNGPARVHLGNEVDYVVVYSTEFKDVDWDTVLGYMHEGDFPDESVSRICYVMTPEALKGYLIKKWAERVEQEKQEAEDTAKKYTTAYMGTAEASECLGVSKQTLCNWVKRKREDLPEPIADLAMGPIWKTEDILKFKKEVES